jgi:hypothetical protein
MGSHAGRDLFRRLVAAAGAAVATLTTAVYLGVVTAQGGDDTGLVLGWTVVMLAAAATALASAVARDPHRARVLALGAAVALGLLGVLSAFTVGAGFLLAALLVALSPLVSRADRTPRRSRDPACP